LDLYDAAPSHHLPAINNQTTKRTAPVVSPISNEGVDMSVELQNEIEGLKREISTLKNTIQGIEQICRETRGLVGPFGVPMPDNKMLVQTIHGTKYVIDPHDNVMAPQLIVYRQWEPDLSSLIKSLCKPDTIFVDVGANFGYFSCLAGAKIGTGGKGQVFSIEPNPKLVGLLNTNVQINWSMAPVHVHAVAASDQSGEATLFIPTTGAANASLSYGSENSERVTVTTQRLDDIINPELVIDVMKIDVEGHEVSALKGALQIIKNSPNIVIIMEWSIGQMTNAGHKIDDIITLLNDLNLKAYDIPWSGDMSVSKEIKYDDLRKILYSNIILRRDFT
jgi:FkbM family methyltransferase